MILTLRRILKVLKHMTSRILILALVAIWIFSGFPQIWQKPPIPPKIQKANLSTDLFLTAVLAFAILKIINPPRAYFW
jgi:hypothetical protein